jgi:hypothetical protein
MLKTYRGRQIGWRELFILFIPGGGAALTPLAYGVWRANYGYTHYGPAAAVAWSRSWYLLASFATLALIGLAWLRLRNAHRSVAVHQNGLNLSLTTLRKISLPWEEIEGVIYTSTDQVFLGVSLAQHKRLTLQPRVGKPVNLDDRIQDLDELALEVKRRVYPKIEARLPSAAKDNGSATFGPLTVTPQGMRIQEREFPWGQINTVKIASGFLVVESGASGLMKIPLTRIPNPEILIEHLQQTVNSRE